MTPDKCDLPWTKGGKELLERIKGIIFTNGGVSAMIAIVEKENKDILDSPPIPIGDEWYKVRGLKPPKAEDAIIREHWYTKSTTDIAAMIGRNADFVYKRGKKLNLGRKVFIRSDASAYPNRKQVILAHGKKKLQFPSVKATAEYLKINQGIVSRCLSNGKLIQNKYKVKFKVNQPHEKETINNSQAQKDKAHRYRQEVGTSHHANL